MTAVDDRPGGGRAVVVGGGLAGLVAALRLAQGGVEVTLHEARGRLGGKAGADDVGDHRSDHGYHVFCAWYHNLWDLVDELGIAASFQHRRMFWRLDGRRAATRRGPLALRRSLRPALISPRSLLAAVDLVARDEASLGDASLAGFLEALPYHGPGAGRELRDIALKGLGNPAEAASAVTFRANMALWFQTPVQPNWNIARGDLQSCVIDPLAAAVAAAGVTLVTGSRLEAIELGDDERPVALHVTGGATVPVAATDDVVLALPPEALAPLLEPHRAVFGPLLDDLAAFSSRPMTALDVHLARPLPGLPQRGHVILDGSRHHLSLVDIRPVWGDLLPGPADHPVWQVIAADTRELLHLDDDELIEAVLADLLASLPVVDRRDLARVVPHPNTDAPLFMNEPGTDRRRPRSDQRHAGGLLLAGDWCSTPIQLACMEGAVVSGTLAANVALADRGRPAVRLRLPPPDPPRWAVLARRLLVPLATPIARAYDAWRARARAASSAAR